MLEVGRLINYQKETDAVIKKISGRPKLFLHSCCGPCSTYSIEYLSEYFDIKLFFYNPNITSYHEYQKRLDTQRKVCAEMNVELIEGEYHVSEFIKQAEPFENEKEGGRRCYLCFQMRLCNTAVQAKINGADFFTSTLTVSPHKNAQLINKIGISCAESGGVRWLPCDLKKRGGYKRSVDLSAAFGLYRQSFCGCKYSQNNT